MNLCQVRCALGRKLHWATFAGAAGLLLVFCCCCLAAAGWLLLLLAVRCCCCCWLIAAGAAACCLVAAGAAACCLPACRCRCCGLGYKAYSFAVCHCLARPMIIAGFFHCRLGIGNVISSLVAGLFGETRCPMRKPVSQGVWVLLGMGLLGKRVHLAQYLALYLAQPTRHQDLQRCAMGIAI